MPLELESYVWADEGTDPRTLDGYGIEDFVYLGGQQPPAEIDNHVNWMVTHDLHQTANFINQHVHEHESGGSQEIDLDGLSVGTIATLQGDEDTNELQWHAFGGDSVARIDIPAERVRQFPEFATQLAARDGLTIDNDITRYDGEVLYDKENNRFHRAKTAQSAAEADWAADAGALGGINADEYLLPGDDVTILGTWAYENPLHADIHGHASTASAATEADWAAEADWSAEADNAQTLQGNTPSDLINDAVDEADHNHSVSESGTQITSDVNDVSFDGPLEVTDLGNDNVGVDVGKVDEAAWADNAGDADTLQGYTPDDIINETISIIEDEWEPIIDDGDDDENSPCDFHWVFDMEFDIIRLQIYHEVCIDFPDSKSYMRLRLNGETRSRYNYSKVVRDAATGKREFDHVPDNWAWPVADARPQEFASTTYEISAPQSMSNISRHYPTISKMSQGVNEKVSGTLEHGAVETNFDGIGELEMQSRTDATAKVKAWGKKL